MPRKNETRKIFLEGNPKNIKRFVHSHVTDILYKDRYYVRYGWLFVHIIQLAQFSHFENIIHTQYGGVYFNLYQN